MKRDVRQVGGREGSFVDGDLLGNAGCLVVKDKRQQEISRLLRFVAALIRENGYLAHQTPP